MKCHQQLDLKDDPNPVILVNDSAQPVCSPVEVVRTSHDFALLSGRNQAWT